MSGKIQIPTNTMEQEFANYERRGYQKGLAVNAAHITELIANLQTQRREYLALEAQLADAKKDAVRYQLLRREAVELSLSHQVISQFVTNQGELDAAIQAEVKA